jgi:hypothetical protein
MKNRILGQPSFHHRLAALVGHISHHHRRLDVVQALIS